VRKINFLFACLTISVLAFSQNLVKGEVKNQEGKRLKHVSIYVQSSHSTYYTELDGKFELLTKNNIDTITLSFPGYQTAKLIVNAPSAQSIILKKITARTQFNFLSGNNLDEIEVSLYGKESYSSMIENPEISTSKSPSVSFTVNTNRASYSNLRRFINMNSRVPEDAIRIEEMLNYFNFNHIEPANNELFATSAIFSNCPWNDSHQLMFLNISARKLDLSKVPPGNFVLLIDVSGSMDLPNKLPLVKSGLHLLIKNLRNIDTVSLVTYGNTANIVFEGVSGNQKDSLQKAIENLSAEGSTPGEAGLRMAYKVAKRRLTTGGNNRIILATDGDFNVGVSTEKELEELIEQQGETGIHLTCLGVGIGNYKDSKLSVLALKGRGNFAYIDNEEEAEKVFVTELTQTFFAVAEDVYLTVQFDSSVVKEFRLIGYDNKNGMAESLSEIGGGEIGSGHSILALFEIATVKEFKNNQQVAFLTINYRIPDSPIIQKQLFGFVYKFVPYNNLEPGVKKAINVTMLGMKLKSSKYAKKISWLYIERNGEECFKETTPTDEQYLSLIHQVRKIYKRKPKE
jgi:Ca-activated chloride channel family protein